MIHICIPCRDEDRTIGVLLWKIRHVMGQLGRDFHVLVLDDASTDGTRALLEKYRRVMPLTVLTERRSIGYGRAIEKLLRAATGRTRYPKRDAIVTMQADFTEHPEHLHALVKTFEGGADIVAGESATGVADVPRRVRFARWLGGKAIGRMVPDASGGDWLAGFRVYRVIVVRKAIREAGDRRLIRTDGWAANAELMRVLTPFARRIAHVPLTRRYDMRPRGTRLRVLPTLRQILRLRKSPRWSRRAMARSSLPLTAGTVLLTALAVGAVAASASGQTTTAPDSLDGASPEAASVPFAPGEHLRYKVKYGIFSVGEAHMTIAGIDTIHGMPTYVAEWRLKGSVLGYGIDETFTSWIDTEGLFARRFVKDQGKRYREYEFFPAERRVQRIDHDTTWALPDPEPLDDISVVYFTRTLALDVGQSYTFDRFYNDEGNPIVLNVLRRDRREVGAGEFNTVVVRPIIQTDGLFSEGGDAEIHFSDDERRMVVYMKVDGPFLPLNLTLHLEEILHVDPGTAAQTPDDVPDSG